MPRLGVKSRHLSYAPPPLPIGKALWEVVAAMLAKDPLERLTAVEAARVLRNLPAVALTDQALPVQASPGKWVNSTVALPSQEDVEATLRGEKRKRRGSETGAMSVGRPLDPNMTDQVVDRPARQRRDGIQNMAGTGPDFNPDDPSMTLSKDESTREQVITVPQLSTPNKKSRLVPIIIGTVGAIVVVAVAVILWLTGALRPSATTPTPEVTVATLPGHVTGKTLATGLRIDLDASWDQTKKLTALTVSVAAPTTTGLMGDILLVIPSLSDQCPTITPRDPATLITGIKASTDGFAIPCGQKLTNISVDANQTMTITLDVEMEMNGPNGQPPDSYGTWLDTIRSSTESALSAITGTAFPLQRVHAIVASIDSVTLTSVDGTTVPYSVSAQWVGDSNPAMIVSEKTTAGMETDLLNSLTGGKGVGGITIDACDETRKTGIQIMAMQPTASCHVSIHIGALTTPPVSFPIYMM